MRTKKGVVNSQRRVYVQFRPMATDNKTGKLKRVGKSKSFTVYDEVLIDVFKVAKRAIERA